MTADPSTREGLPVTPLTEVAATAPVADVPAAVAADTFKAIFRRHPAGVAIVALADGDRPVGFTATSVISVSADPPLLAFSIAATSSAWPTLAEATSLTVNFLGAEQVDVSARFATRGVDRFAGVDWHRLPTGEPVLDDAPAWVRGEVVQRIPAGSSFLVLVRVLESAQPGATAPLVYHDRAYHQLGDGSAL
ncbi:flavin reductase family protein [Microlunatus flavus]|uniref:NADH-FMN oxidoreductase RutF, flavin reductase (DIM6/NTAB) family n=1 Tax=Microlunatus flavus TaxID=1036181 RepID=A0A1H9N8H3_9ACTN|nr:flavin reductase family protein [Microlunatus flavus]SER31959.1 NADH-FMN oxidoreductase RutF, flavin reductase (DIM6/NTAB) family [Microlunatus flavus]